jgi:hypothetical protein
MQISNCVFYTAECVVADYISGYPDDEEIADTLIENVNRWDPRVGAGENRGHWFLLVHDRLPAFFAMIWVKKVAFNETFVALQEFFQNLFSGGAFVCIWSHRFFSLNVKMK